METMMQEILHSGLRRKYAIIHIDNSKPTLIRRASLKHSGYRAALLRNPLLTLYSFTLSLLFLVRYLVILVSKPVDVIHIHTASYSSFWEKALFILAGKLFAKPIILHIHGARFDHFYNSSRTPVRGLIKKIIMLCDRVIALSQYWQDFFTGIAGETRVLMVENCINTLAYINSKTAKTEKPTVLFLGELSHRKGIDDLFKIANYIKNKGVTARFIAAGPGNFSLLNSRLQEQGLQDIVVITPPVFGEPKRLLLAQSWMFILPSYAEGMPIAIIEALAAGLPVIATQVGGLTDMITNRVNGFLAPPGNIELLGNSILALLQNDHLRHTIAANNTTLAVRRFDIHLLVDRLDSIYSGLIRA